MILLLVPVTAFAQTIDPVIDVRAIENPIRPGHEQTLIIQIVPPEVPYNITVTDPNNNNMTYSSISEDPGPFNIELDPVVGLMIFAKFRIPGNAIEGTYTATVEAPYDPEYNTNTTSFEVVAPQ
jgi:hypothetical protein